MKPSASRRLGLLCAAVGILAGWTGCAAQRSSTTGPPSLSGPGPRPFAGHPYERHFQWKDWRVKVREVPGDGSGLTWFEVQVGRKSPQGETFKFKSVFDVDGHLQRTWFGDLHGNGWPDLLVYTTSGERGAYGSIRILECHEEGFHRAKIPVVPPALMEGYRGGDLWNLENKELLREFPVYLPHDRDEAPRGGRRILRFTWEKGRWRLRYRTNPTFGVGSDASGVSPAGPGPAPEATETAGKAEEPAGKPTGPGDASVDDGGVKPSAGARISPKPDLGVIHFEGPSRLGCLGEVPVFAREKHEQVLYPVVK